IADNRIGSPDGTDIVSHVEKLQFSDQLLAVTAPHATTQDFDANGKADILWQNDNGQAGVWLMDGTTQLVGTTVGSNPGVAWHAKGAGDFDGDGKADILWQNDDGTTGVWLMDGATQTAGAVVSSNPGAAWHVKG